MPLLILRMAIAAGLLASHASATSQTDPGKTVFAAAASFSVGYGAWLWEKRCQTLTAELRKDYDTVIADGLKRLQDASDARLVNAAVGSGREVSNGPTLAACDGKDSEGLAQFGLEQARDAQAKLKSLPAGYHLTITN